ncbi:MAG: flippase [Candidatus Buchananbacteria bacterium]
MSERNLAKNTVYYSAALAMQKVLSFGFFIILARSLGVAGQGRFTFALSFAALFAIFLDLGLSQILIRETARDKKKAEKYLASTIGFKLLAALLLYLVIVAAVNLMGYPVGTRQLVYVSALVMLIDSLTLSIYSVIRGWQNLGYESIGTIGNQLIVLLLGGTLLLMRVNPVLVMGVYAISSLANLIWSAFNLNRVFKIKVKISFDWPMIKMLLALSLPFAVAGIFSRIFSSTDVVILSKLSGDHAVGIYSAAFKVAFALQFAALAFSASLYPAFSTYWAHSKENLSKLFTKSMFWLVFLAGPMVFGVIAIADPAIPMVFGSAYAASVLPLQILMASMLFVFLCFPIGALLNACDQQKRHTINMGITALASVILNFLLIPFLSYNGAAIANLASYIILFILGLMVVNRITPYDKKYLLWSSMKILLACITMFAVVWIIKIEFNFVAAVIAGVIVYLILAYLLKIFSIRAIKEFIGSLRKGAAKNNIETEEIL